MPSQRLVRSLLGGQALFEDATGSTAFLTRALMVGSGLMTAIGIVDLVVEPSVQSAYLPTAAAVVSMWCWVKLRVARPDPVPVLAGAVVLSVGFPAMALSTSSVTDLSNSANIVIITAAGILALNLPGHRKAVSVAFHLLAVGTAVLLVQTGLDPRPLHVAIDVAVSMLAVGIAFFLVASARRALEASQERYRGVLATAPTAVLELNLAEVRRLLEAGVDEEDARLVGAVAVLEANAAADEFIDDDRRLRLGDRIDAEGRSTIARLFAHMADKPVGEDTVAFTIGGEARHMHVLWSTHPSGRVTVVTVDVTHRVETEQALADQIRARDRFIASVSHELRTPLTAVLGLVEEINDESRPIADDERSELLRLARDQARDVSDIVHDLLVAARAEVGGLVIRPETVDVTELVRQVAAAYPAFVVEADEPLLAMVDPLRLRQVLRNLVSNAVRHGGERRRVRATRRGAEVAVEVRDSGPPIPDDERHRVFDPYYRTVESIGTPDSVGIGLSVARQLAILMGGDVTYQHDGAESVFSVLLPPASSDGGVS